MSQFSESYHYRSIHQQEVIDLLRNSKLEGYIFPEENGWITFVVKDGNFEPVGTLISHNKGLLLHYVYAEDHGWGLRLFNQTEELSQYFCAWEDEVDVDDKKFDKTPYITHKLLEENSEAFALLLLEDAEDVFNEEPFFKIPQELGLTYYDWISFDNVDGNLEEYKGVVHIN
jgi:hypothetical protein